MCYICNVKIKQMNTIDLKKNSKEELIIYIEKMSRDMTKIQEENLELRKENQQMQDYINQLDTMIQMEVEDMEFLPHKATVEEIIEHFKNK